MRRMLAGAIAAVVLAATVPGVAAQQSEQESERTHETEHFSVTYVDDPASRDAPDLTDSTGDGVPDAVARLADSFEAARAFLVSELGYRDPPIQDDLYPVYVARGDGVGHVQPSPGGEGRSRSSFIVVPPHRVQATTRDAAMASFAVHEYFHAIQLGLDSGEDRWIREASSTWAEGIYPAAADSGPDVLQAFVPFPRRSLFSTGEGHEYGAFLFLRFLTERYGGGSVAGAGMVRELWEEMAVPEAIPGAPDRDSRGALEAVLARRGVELAEAWGEFLLWRRQLGRFEEGAAYRAALAGAGTPWPRLLGRDPVRAESCRLTTDTDEGAALPEMSGDYVRLHPHPRGPLRAQAHLAVRGPQGAAGFAIVKPRGVPGQLFPLVFDDGIAALDVPFGRRRIARVILGLGHGATEGSAATLEYSLRLAGRPRVRVSAPAGAATTIYGTGVFLSGTVTCRGLPAASARVAITEEEVVSGATQRFETTTDRNGRWSLVVVPEANAVYSVEVIDPLLSSDAAGDKPVGVRVAITAVLERDRVPLGEEVVLRGEVIPPHPGAPVVLEFRRPERAWRTGMQTTLDEQGRYELSFEPPATGVWQVRARVLDTLDDDHLPDRGLGRLVHVTAP